MSSSPTRPSLVAALLAALFALCTIATQAQTLLQLYDINSGAPIRYPSILTAYDGMFYFRGAISASSPDVELWRTNGVYAELAADVYPGPTGSSPAELTVYNGKLYFQARGTTGSTTLWQYDPINGATLAPGSSAGASVPDGLTVYNGSLYYQASKYSNPNVGSELWKFNGTTQAWTDLYPGTGSSGPQHFTEYAGQLYFNANIPPDSGAELWRTNGTTITKAATINTDGSSPENFTVFNNQLYFSAYDGTRGRELWKFDAATDQPTLVADILPGGQYASSNPSNLCVYNNKLYFCADDGILAHGKELWSYDGINPPAMVVEINPTPNPLNGDDFLMDSSPSNLTLFNNILYFSANDGTHGRELWAFDGAQAWMVSDINPGQYGSDPSEFIVFNDALYYSAYTGGGPGDAQLESFVIPVPEPAALSILAILGLCLTRRR